MTEDAGAPDVLRNPLAGTRDGPDPGAISFLGMEAHGRALREIQAWPGYAPTPLVRLPGLAERTGVGEVRVKDEGARFGIGSFKALGGAYGVVRAVARETASRTGEDRVSPEVLLRGRHADLVSEMTVTCATDGNHGRAVAWGAEIIGCDCVVYIPDHVTPAREEAIAGHGARVVRIAGSYDDAVERADREAAAEGRIVVSDVAYPGYEEIPRTVMQGYTVMVAEILERMQGERLTHVFLQAGVGGFAAAIAGHLRHRLGSDRPRIVIVEPREADGLYQSARAGERRDADGSLDTLMGGLSCRAVSPVAWPILRQEADAFIRIPDAAAAEAMRLLAGGVDGDPPVVAGESGAAGAAGLVRSARDEEARHRLGLDSRSRVLLVVTEEATDPERYRRIVGRSAEEVRPGAPRTS